MNRKRTFSFVTLLSALLSPVANSAETKGNPLDAPEAAFWHTESRTWFVSNLGGGISLARDGFGWLTRYDENGKLLNARWVEGMDAPTGIAAVGNLLYVADRAGVHEIDVKRAKILRTIEIPNSKFLNDIAAAPNGELFISDFEANRIYRLNRERKAEVWLDGVELQNPNGLIVEGNNLIIATWGPMTDPSTFAVKHPGTLLKAELATRKLSPIGKGHPIASFDGVVAIGNHYFATDWPSGRLLRISKKGIVREVLTGFYQLADLGYNPEREVIAMPVMSDSRLIFLHLDALSKE
ncbi:MAG: SMP-30/gluconolactonase/LRE family protein [Candidatus Omnitrophica bacterium]|nr:SMP-30/gluconolactonase/LRE family protein [Candidatus Omnitrophota bacterium]